MTSPTTFPSVHLNRLPLVGVPHKPLDNPPHLKPGFGTEAGRAVRLEQLVRRLPREISPAVSRFPLLDGLFAVEATAAAAKELVFLAAATHVDADERRTAEYLLRHRLDLVDGVRPATAVLRAARCAAEMDVRRVRARELPVDAAALAERPLKLVDGTASTRSVGELVLDYLVCVVDWVPASHLVRHRLLDAVAVAMDLAERHTLMGGRGPAVLAMRSSARPSARLVAALRAEFGNDRLARGLARLLIGGDRSPIEASLLWWVAQRTGPDTGIAPPHIRRRWLREVHAIQLCALPGHDRLRSAG